MNSGRADRNAATTPETCGAAIEVPDCSAYAGGTWPEASLSGRPARARIPPTAADVIHSPGATTSGFRRPSRVGPLLEVQVMPKACGASRCVDPTAMQFSACAGSVTERRAANGCGASGSPAPELPADTTTTTPESTSWLTAWHSGDCPAA